MWGVSVAEVPLCKLSPRASAESEKSWILCAAGPGCNARAITTWVWKNPQNQKEMSVAMHTVSNEGEHQQNENLGPGP